MAKQKPWVKWYPADIINSFKYRALSRSAKLTYRELLDHLWMEGCALPNKPRLLAGAVGLSLEEFQRDWEEIQDPDSPCFIEHPDQPDKLTNQRMLEEWEAVQDKAEVNRENGQKGGRPPKKTQAKPTGLFSETQPEPNGNPDPTQTEPDGNPDQTQAEPNPNRTKRQLEKETEKEEEIQDPPSPPVGGGRREDEFDHGPGPNPNRQEFLRLAQQGATEYVVTEAEIQERMQDFPALGEDQIRQSLRDMRAYLRDNPSRRPKHGRRFVTNWLRKDNQAEASRSPPPERALELAAAGNPFMQALLGGNGQE